MFTLVFDRDRIECFIVFHARNRLHWFWCCTLLAYITPMYVQWREWSKKKTWKLAKLCVLWIRFRNSFNVYFCLTFCFPLQFHEYLSLRFCLFVCLFFWMCDYQINRNMLASNYICATAFVTISSLVVFFFSLYHFNQFLSYQSSFILQWLLFSVLKLLNSIRTLLVICHQSHSIHSAWVFLLLLEKQNDVRIYFTHIHWTPWRVFLLQNLPSISLIFEFMCRFSSSSFHHVHVISSALER